MDLWWWVTLVIFVRLIKLNQSLTLTLREKYDKKITLVQIVNVFIQKWNLWDFLTWLCQVVHIHIYIQITIQAFF